MGRREKKKEYTRTRIIEEAKKEFIREGYEHAKLSNISKACGIAEGTLFNYFKDKSALFVATFTMQPCLNYKQFRITQPNSVKDFVDELIYILDFFMRIEDAKLEEVFKTFYHYMRQQQLQKDYSVSDEVDDAGTYIMKSVNELAGMVKWMNISQKELISIIEMQVNGIYEEYVYRGMSFDEFLQECRAHLTLICEPFWWKKQI